MYIADGGHKLAGGELWLHHRRRRRTLSVAEVAVRVVNFAVAERSCLGRVPVRPVAPTVYSHRIIVVTSNSTKRSQRSRLQTEYLQQQDNRR